MTTVNSNNIGLTKPSKGLLIGIFVVIIIVTCNLLFSGSSTSETVFNLDMVSYIDDNNKGNQEMSIEKMNYSQCSQFERLNQLKMGCKNDSLNTKRFHPSMYKERLLVDNKHQTIYCVIPKCGSSTWKTMMVNLTGNDPELGSNGVAYGAHDKGYLLSKHRLAYLDVFPSHVQEALLKEYFKFIVVRHPLDRLYSAFNGKFIHGGSPTKGYKIIGNKIKERFGKRGQDDMENPIEFWEFLKFATARYKSNRDPHWINYIDLCNPCEIDYDYIVKLETSDYDSEFIVNKMTGKNGFHIPQVNSRRERGKPERVVEQYKNVPEDVMDEVLKYYDVDMKLFGYTWNKSNFVASCKQNYDHGECC